MKYCPMCQTWSVGADNTCLNCKQTFRYKEDNMLVKVFSCGFFLFLFIGFLWACFEFMTFKHP